MADNSTPLARAVPLFVRASRCFEGHGDVESDKLGRSHVERGPPMCVCVCVRKDRNKERDNSPCRSCALSTAGPIPQTHGSRVGPTGSDEPTTETTATAECPTAWRCGVCDSRGAGTAMAAVTTEATSVEVSTAIAWPGRRGAQRARRLLACCGGGRRDRSRKWPRHATAKPTPAPGAEDGRFNSAAARQATPPPSVVRTRTGEIGPACRRRDRFAMLGESDPKLLPHRDR